MDNAVIIFGAGKIGTCVAYILKAHKVSVAACFDNDLKKAGQKIWEDISCGMPALISPDMPVLISIQDEQGRQEIRKQCEALGYQHIYVVDIKQLYMYLDQLSDAEFLELQYFIRMDGKTLDLKNPQTFNGKIQWLKLYDHNPQYTVMVDKYQVKKYVAGIIGEEYMIPTLGVWDHWEDIDFARLPDQFVLKCTHDSGSTYIVRDKRDMDYQSVSKSFKQALQTDYYRIGREWAYKHVVPRIIAEPLIESKNNMDLLDYKLMCFNGRVRCSFVCTNRHSKKGLRVTFYDTDWKRMPFERHYPSDDIDCRRPDTYDEMVRLAEKLSADIPFARIDFYECDGRLYFGEITLYPGCGYEEFMPEEWDEILGSWLELPAPSRNQHQC